MCLTDQEAETVFAAIRWADSNGKAICPRCKCTICYDCRRPNGAPSWRCKACRSDFSLTSGTLFAFHKLALRVYIAAIVIFINEVKGKSMLALSRDLDIQYKTAFVLAHKLREAMAAEIKANALGAGKVAEVDGAWFGGHVRPENRKADRKDRRRKENQSGKRKSVVVFRERDGRPRRGSSSLRMKALRSSKPTSTRRPPSMPMKLLHGTTCMDSSKCSESIIRSATWEKMGPALTMLNPISAVCVGPNSATTIT